VAAGEVRRLASSGELAHRAATASPADYRLLHRGAYAICWPIVFQRLTRGLEYGRGHSRCAAGLEYLQPDCLDRLHDDTEASVVDLLRNAKISIRNVEGWIARRIGQATVDANRRRRSERGAVQRPRLPQWLAAQLGRNAWLSALAVDVQAWVGVPATAGTGLWPYGVWTDRRIAATGDYGGTEHETMEDVETVLAAMRVNRAWYEKYIERPLGRKVAPVLAVQPTAQEGVQDLPLTLRHESEEAQRSELAATAIDAIAARLDRGEDPRTVVVEIIQAVFGSGTGADGMDQPPGEGCADDESALRALADPATVDRIVNEILTIVDPPTT
jgi:hypothetical protein